ncbi:MAG: hypothetical protein EOP90_11955 [Lysobacteraceae bacterium]|nr:MAG: hypothetical protein EOP90_11955 [Xanthomonadaceae bacterium]
MRRSPVRARWLLALALCAAALDAQSGGGFAIRRSTVDAGGGPSASGAYAVTGTVGQPDAHYSEGGAYAVRGGFWGAGGNLPSDAIFADGFE